MYTYVLVVDSPSFLRPVLLSFLALDLHLSPMASSIGKIQILLANEFLPGQFSVGIKNFPEIIEGLLVASLGRNLPVTDSDFMVAKIVVFGHADIVTRTYVPSQGTHSLKQSGPFRIDS